MLASVVTADEGESKSCVIKIDSRHEAKYLVTKTATKFVMFVESVRRT